MSIDLIFFKSNISSFLNDLTGSKVDVENRGSESLRFEIPGYNFVIAIDVENNNGYKYINLTNLLLCNSMKSKGVSLWIIDHILALCEQRGYVVYAKLKLGQMVH